MAFPSAPSTRWSVSLLTVLFTAAVHSNIAYDEDPLQPVTSDETVPVGGTVTLTCRVAESDNSSLQWSNTAQQTLYFGGKRALRDNRIQLYRSLPTELSITIADVQLSDEGEYTCSIFTMPVRTARATVTVLGVPSKPQISGSEDAVMEGETVTLTCTSTGSKPPAKIQWYKGAEELTDHLYMAEPLPDGLTYNVSSTLSLTVSSNDDNVPITCAVNHPSLALGDKRSEQALRVLYSPIIQIQPEKGLPREGGKFSLQCLTNGNPEPANYIWERRDGDLPLLAKPDGAVLYFSMLNKSDNGVYVCHADNGIGKSSGEYTLQVQDLTKSDSPDTTQPPIGSPDSSSFTHLLPLSSTPDVFFGSGSESTDFPLFSSSTTSPSTAVISTTLSFSATTTLSNALFPDMPLSPESSSSSPKAVPSSASIPPLNATPSSSSSSSPTSPVSVRLDGLNTFTEDAGNIADPTAMSTSSGVDHAVIGGVVAVIVFILLCLLIVFGRYLIRHKGTYLTHEAKGSDDAPDADTAIINAEGGHSGADDKKEYFI
ncbi:cell adhesion molecule 3 isoform X2 [Oryzias latipes]|uniref:cell adhesion molecule 3 isoform X2 n=1 Tax=Oryzias latipes TaxID=8090 RepID=UPI0005CC3B77|nr:cell adhesion molecule 3 isoform X2 [Oryzias latipes]